MDIKISAIFILGLGLILIILGILVSYIFLFYGVPILIIGIFVLFNKSEDKIEKIKYERREK